MPISGDQVFVGTWGSGVYRAPLHESVFELLNRENNGALRHNIISAVMASDETGRPWLGSFGGGPQRVNVATHQIVPSQGMTEQIATTGVFDMKRDGRGRLFAATTNGLFRFSEDGSELEVDEHDPDNPDSIGDGYVYALLPAGSEDMWVGVAGSGLHYREGSTGAYTVYRHESDQPDSLSGNFITTLIDGRPGYIWVGTRSNGLNLCRVEDFTCQQCSGRSDSPSSLSHFHVTALFRDRRDRLGLSPIHKSKAVL
jgi:ligand-binding sensor domain-containing protein